MVVTLTVVNPDKPYVVFKTGINILWCYQFSRGAKDRKFCKPRWSRNLLYLAMYPTRDSHFCDIKFFCQFWYLILAYLCIEEKISCMRTFHVLQYIVGDSNLEYTSKYFIWANGDTILVFQTSTQPVHTSWNERHFQLIGRISWLLLVAE